jgi:hypothetical protein
LGLVGTLGSYPAAQAGDLDRGRIIALAAAAGGASLPGATAPHEPASAAELDELRGAANGAPPPDADRGLGDFAVILWDEMKCSGPNCMMTSASGGQVTITNSIR